MTLVDAIYVSLNTALREYAVARHDDNSLKQSIEWGKVKVLNEVLVLAGETPDENWGKYL